MAGLTTDQFAAITNEYGSITSEINRIGNATNFNGNPVFSSVNTANPNQAATTATSNLGVNSDLTSGDHHVRCSWGITRLTPTRQEPPPPLSSAAPAV